MNDEIEFESEPMEDQHLDAAYEERTEIEEPYDGGGWPGDGSGMDDLEDYNQQEAADYAHEGE